MMRPIRSLTGGALVLLACLACGESDPPSAPNPNGTTLGVAAVSAADAGATCGLENGAACGLPPRCDRGLKLDNRGTPLNLSDDRCIDDTRHVMEATFRGTWEDWALANQRTLALDEPINWVQHLSTHNANNNLADGETFDPNQAWSLSDQLGLGSRFLWLDLHWVTGVVRLCHAVEIDFGPGFHVGCGPLDRPFAYAVREIADWLAANPDEIVMMDLEAWVEDQTDPVADALEAHLGPLLFRNSERTDRLRWPTRRELLAAGKRALVMARGIDFRGINTADWIPYRKYGRFVASLAVSQSPDGIVLGCQSTPSQEEPLVLSASDTSFQVMGEDRTTLSRIAFHTGFMDSAAVRKLAGCNIPLQSLDMLSAQRPGPIPSPLLEDIIDLAQKPNRLPDEDLQRYLVWSWAEGDRGDRGDAALLRGSTGRWASADASGSYRFACARERSETRLLGVGMAAWPDPQGTDWRITSREGAWHEGGRACLDEFGADGFVFSVPRNGRMNGHLRFTDPTRGDLWLGYNDLEDEGAWVINRRPVANAGPDRTVECNGHTGTTVQLDAGGSTDPEGHALTFEWHGAFGQASGAQPVVTLPLGRHEIVLIADDGFAGASADTVVIEVVDTTPPEIRSATAAPDSLWPPSHGMEAVVVTVDVHDLCDPNPVCRIVSVASSEPANGPGDGNTEPDWRITGPLTVELRAERAGPGDGRTYTLVIVCTDASGNSATTEVRVTVPHHGGDEAAAIQSARSLME